MHVCVSVSSRLGKLSILNPWLSCVYDFDKLCPAVLCCAVPCCAVPCCVVCRYGFGVGGEYPMASASAAERSQADDELRHRRGEQVVMVFSGQVR
jgi:hypothetical protein